MVLGFGGRRGRLRSWLRRGAVRVRRELGAGDHGAGDRLPAGHRHRGPDTPAACAVQGAALAAAVVGSFCARIVGDMPRLLERW